MNVRVTLGFLVALALLAGVVVGLDRFKPPEPSAKEPGKSEEVSVLQFDDHKVTAFDGRADDKTVRLEKDGDTNWKIAGSNEPANRTSFNSLIARMSQLKGTRRVAEASSDLKEFGLAEPKDEATAELDDGTKLTLDLGDKTPVGTGTYAKKADSSEVFVIPTQFGTDLERLVNEPKEPPTPTPRPSPSPEGSAPAEATPTP